jgi:membrane protein YqaA with SNARE-associated domain
MPESIAQDQNSVIEATNISFDRFQSSRAALMLAFAWGLAEAIFFFIVPDVLLTLLACRALKPALKASLAALAGAIAGGAAMYCFAMLAPDRARDFLDYVPAISPNLIAKVAGQIDERGLIAILLGPLRGIPYKIYAVEWGARGGSLSGLLLISIPARYVRFFLATIVARMLARTLEPLTDRRARREVLILAIIWIVFYGYYFWRFGW